MLCLTLGVLTLGVHEVCQCVVTDSAESCVHTTRLSVILPGLPL